MLQDGQVWESPLYVLKIELMGSFFRGVVFRKEKDNTLKFIEVVFNETKQDRLTKMLERMSFTLTGKKLTTTKGIKNVKRRSGLAKRDKAGSSNPPTGCPV
jgi:hypothetical protein